ncbi:MAG: glycine cleavage system protein GcvH [Betaproteobacteria bacterium]
MDIPADRKYSDTHQWALTDADGTISVGITHHAQDLLGDLIYVEAPAPGRKLTKGEQCGVVESVKSASDIYAPVSGNVSTINPELDKAPERINQNAYEAWIFKIEPADIAEIATLLDAEAYRALIEA